MNTPDPRPAIYADVGANYRAIDDLRLKLLGLLPLATATGLFFLLSKNGTPNEIVAAPAGVFGVLATISLFLYELHGIEKCAHFIHRAQQLEKALGVRGSFTRRPHRVYIANELLPAALIYPASLAGWLYITLVGVTATAAGIRISYVIAVIGFVLGLSTAGLIILIRENARKQEWDKEDRIYAEGIWPD